MKKIISTMLISLSCILSNLSYASSCPQALSVSDPNFCGSFVTAAECYCAEKLPAGVCRDMNVIYERMMGLFLTIDRACQYQANVYHSVTAEVCKDDWNCYLSGHDSKGKACNPTPENPMGHRC